MPLANIEASRKYHRDKYAKNPEKYIDYARQYRKTPKGQKVDRLSRWQKALGMTIPDPEAMYERYMDATECESCKRTFVGTKKCLDHDHISGYPRFVCCVKCNNLLTSRDGKQRLVLLELHRHFLRQ